jgi:Thioredoxin reductase
VSYQLLQAGSDVAGIVEVLPGNLRATLFTQQKSGEQASPFFTEHVVKRVHGDGKVERAVLAPLSDPMNEKEIAVDVICLATGLTPGIELPKMAGCRIVNMKDLGGYVPWHDERMRTSLEDFYVAGDVGGIEEASTAMEKGRVAAISMTGRSRADKPV